jgi:delta(3,5)-delta(2,4)-dienoyl-CoA isomerase
MWKEIGRLFSLLGTQGDDCRAILLKGAGKAFCSGIDISDPSFFTPSEGDATRRGMAFLPQIREMQKCFTAVQDCPVPVICAIHGPCIGAGIDLACCADVRLCCADSVFSVREVRLGLAADVGTLQRMPKICGHDSRVRELCLTGRDFGAGEAFRIGFVSRVLPDHENLYEDALQLCFMISKLSPVAVTGTKLSLNYSRDHSVNEGLEHVACHNSLALLSEDLVTAFASRSPAIASSGGGATEQALFAALLPHSRL